MQFETNIINNESEFHMKFQTVLKGHFTFICFAKKRILNVQVAHSNVVQNLLALVLGHAAVVSDLDNDARVAAVAGHGDLEVTLFDLS